jgi:hydrogenase small subunit
MFNEPVPRDPRIQRALVIPEMAILWITAGLGCDGDSVAMTAATQPSIEDIVLGAIPGIPQVALHHPIFASEAGDAFMDRYHRAARGEIGPFILVVEGSIPDETTLTEGCWAGFGVDPATGQPIKTCDWIDRLAPQAWAVIAIGTCAAYGGIHAMAGNPTGAMGLPDYLGWDFRSKAGIPIVCMPGCPVQPDAFMETLLYLLFHAAGSAPMIQLDEALRPVWLFGQTVHEGCDRGGYYEQADFAAEHGSRKCIVKLGCWGPVVLCNVGKRGWMGGIGGCANVGGGCIGCTMPGFPDKFMPFMEEPPGAKMSTSAVLMYGRTVRALRNFTKSSLDKEPAWRRPAAVVTTAEPTRAPPKR